jgi:hypothetical protein
VGKGTTVERLEITQRRENSRAKNYVSGPEILPLAKSLTERCGATCSKGSRNSGLAEFPGAGNFIISGPQKFG